MIRAARRHRTALRASAISGLAAVLILFGCAGAYASGVQLPDDPEAPQASVLYYRDGTTILARVGVTNRTDVPLGQIPDPVRRAVLAAEDRQFYEHFGLSVRGLARAGLADLFGGRQGASTITQQYARNAYLSQERTADRKAKEAVLAIRLERRYTKDEILQRYLNTIYFGRGAYGIAAAARAYFGIAPSQLTTAQGAVLAAVIKDPWGFDPSVDREAAVGRWQWVLQAMESQSWLDETAAQAMTYPEVLSPTAAGESLSGPNGLVVDAVERELVSRGIPSQVLRTGGLRVVTTLDQYAQQSAIAALEAVPAEAADLHAALVAVDPATGGVRAYYGGNRGQGFFDDAAAQHSPASTFKPIVLAAGLNAGVSYLSRWDGSSPRIFPGRLGAELSNEKNLQCPDCTLEEAMVQSINTSFYALTEQLGAATVRKLAISMGISPTYGGVPSMVDAKGDPLPGKTRSDIAIGRYAVSPADLATVYATLAAGGVRADRHCIESVAGMDGSPWYQAKPNLRRILKQEVAADVTTVLHSAAERYGEPEGHEAAAKSGTQQWGNTKHNQDAWLAGYTPTLAAVVWIGKATPGPIRDAAGEAIAGDGLPARIWRDFMTEALRGGPVVGLPAPAHVGRADVGDAGKSGRAAAVAGSSGALSLVDRTRSGGRTLALTFDDGPSQDTEAVLDLLARYRVTATFCVVGEQVGQYPEIVRRIVAEGHALCNHSMRHDDLGVMAADTARKDLLGVLGEIKAVVPHAEVGYFRAPYGNWGAAAGVAADLGMTPVTWTVDPEDWDSPGVDAIVEAVNQQLKPGGIVLMHDGGGDRTQTVQALERLIPQLLDDGWTFDLPATTVAPRQLDDLVPAGSPSLAPQPSSAPAGSADPLPSETQASLSPSVEPTTASPSADPSQPDQADSGAGPDTVRTGTLPLGGKGRSDHDSG